MKTRFLVRLLLMSAFALIPQLSFAMKTQILDFSQGNINATWEGKGSISMVQAPDGIILTTTGTGFFMTDTPLGISPEAATIVATTPDSTDIYFIWSYNNDPMKHSFDVGVTLRGGEEKLNSFSLSDVRNWKRGDKQIGIALPSNTQIKIHRIELYQWNVVERLTEALRSFWTMDQYRPYTINFVWGPEMATNPVERSELFQVLPPMSISGIFVLSILLLMILGILGVYFYTTGKNKKKFLKTAALCILAFWMLFDLRMGSEFLGYMIHDAKTYIAAPEGQKVLRDRDRFYDFAAFAAPFVADRETYVFFAQLQWPYLGNMRYITYPAIPGIDPEHDDTWVVYDRPDLSVGPSGQVMAEGEAISFQGKVLGKFDEHSFIFRTNEPPVPRTAE